MKGKGTFRYTQEYGRQEAVVVASRVVGLTSTRDGYTVIHLEGGSNLVAYEGLATIEQRLQEALGDE